MRRVKWLVSLPEQLEQAVDLKQESMFDRLNDNQLVLSVTLAEISKTSQCHKKIKSRHELAYNNLLKNLKLLNLSLLTLIAVSCSFLQFIIFGFDFK